MTDLYEDLGVHPEADTVAIKRARNKVAKEHHPDKGGDPDKFAKAQRAYLILADPVKRAKYDKGEDVSDGPSSDTADKPDIISRVMQDKIDGNKRAIMANEHTLELMNAALAYLVDYDWETDPPVNQGGFGNMMQQPYPNNIDVNGLLNQQMWRPTDYKNY